MNATQQAAIVSRDLAEFCTGYTMLGFSLARWFLIVALVVAVLETGLTLWSKVAAARAAPEGSPARAAADSAAIAKLLEALKGLLEALTKLPAWIAIFLAGLALLWISSQQPDACAPGLGRGATSQQQPPDAPGQPTGNQQQSVPARGR